MYWTLLVHYLSRKTVWSTSVFQSSSHFLKINFYNAGCCWWTEIGTPAREKMQRNTSEGWGRENWKRGGWGGKQPWRKRWKTIGGRGSRGGGGDEERWLKKGMTNGRGKRNISARLHVELRPSERVSTKNVQPAAEKTPFLSAKNEKFRISFVSDGQISPRCARIM